MCFFWRAEKSLHDFCKQFELNHCAWSTDYALIILTPSLHRAPKKGKYRNNYHFCRELIYWKTASQCGCFIHCMRQKRPKKYLGNINNFGIPSQQLNYLMKFSRNIVIFWSMTSKIFWILARSFEVCLASSYVLRTFFGDNRLSSLQNLSPYDELHADKKSFQNASFICCLPWLSIVFELLVAFL